jgi:hypothetical protein
VVPEDPLVQLAAGQSLFRVAELLELVLMVEESSQKCVKKIMGECLGNVVVRGCPDDLFFDSILKLCLYLARQRRKESLTADVLWT